VFKEENAKLFWPVSLDGKKMLREAPLYLNQIRQILSDSLPVAVLEKEALFSVSGASPRSGCFPVTDGIRRVIL
jgi:hypothetical protein